MDRSQSISRIQEIQFELMRQRVNNYDGEQVVADLLRAKSLWRSAMLTRLMNVGICLRDIDQDVWNADTLLVLSSGVDDAELERLAGGWHADEIRWSSVYGLSSVAGMAGF